MLAPPEPAATVPFVVSVPSVAVTVWPVSADVVLEVALSPLLSRYSKPIGVGAMSPGSSGSRRWRSATR